ncbi:PhzF family phenazine biosynthesis protein [Corynebacterium glutamicum]|uniref:PhzF family phenazine biosynthesis protein n=1 Tax=Corynebacterium glutamicum TaxID=1718 RepID=UPI0004F869DD|nr:PhzF family phenazine biosynthesis protein [Corynebacterium glutamicum]AIK88935.1 phenazine biosynthesis protein PhzF [Corynebacterium glutamicum]
MPSKISRPYYQVDVFSSEPFMGNPLAVIADADDLSAEQMARIARWTNLSETTFLLKPTQEGADYRVRIFTPTGELPFAGHPTLGTAHVFRELHGEQGTQLVQECVAGLVAVRAIDGPASGLAFQAPPTLKDGPLDASDLDAACEALGISPDFIRAHQWVDNGPGWAVVELPSAQHVLDLEPDFSAHPTLKLGVIGAYPEGAPHAFEVRAFAQGIGEDPVTGSLNASIAQWLHRDGRAGEGYLASQGTAIGRAGEIHISIESHAIWVGSSVTTIFQGTAEF